MATHLQELLRSLCLKTEWNYAVLWKLEHRARMVLTWEDAYYQSHPKHETKCNEALGSLHDGHFSHDTLGLAVAKMSYHVYSLGEGIIGQVAITGKHQWIFSDEHQHVVNSLSSSEHYDGWQAQFLAGVQTIVVAAVLPHGVVQLGSLSKVNEDLNLVARLRDLFSTIQDSPGDHISKPIQQSRQTILHTPDILHGCLLDPAKAVTGGSTFVPIQKQDDGCQGVVLPSHICEAVGLVRSTGLDLPFPQDIENAKTVHLAYKKQELKAVTDHNVQKVTSVSQPNAAESHILCDALLSTTKYGAKCNHLSSSQSLNRKLQREDGNNVEFPADDNCLETLTSSRKLTVGYELHEALGSAFLKENYPSWWETEKPEPASISEIADGMEHSMLTSDTGTDHLLDAVVANFCNKDVTLKRVESFATSFDSLLTTEKTPEPSSNTSHTIGSACYSMDCSSILEKSIQYCLTSSGSYGMKTSNGFSSSGPSLCKGQSLPPTEPGKGNKKRARPGESCRPRPRDRQLIQDRIKELRELVPSGSKCSIDSLLERTIKHMLFLQSISKHADKLNTCARSRVSKDGSSHEQGASWAVEVGGHMKICPIVVENLNMNGQLMIEMLCEDCDYFLQIAEAIRGLGLTILKGITEAHADKTWMRFVVEGQNNRKMHRMDVLWSLVQILQTETAI
ncbi:hypothetical protein V2J09_022128 [Rumex salicifolius]